MNLLDTRHHLHSKLGYLWVDILCIDGISSILPSPVKDVCKNCFDSLRLMLIYFILRTIDKKMYMCLDCHNGLSDSIVTGQLLDSLKRPRFESWNDTSLSNTFIVSIGYNGKEAQELAIKLLENYIDWTEQNPIVEDIHEPPSTEYAKAVLACSLKVQDIFAEEGLCMSKYESASTTEGHTY